MGMNMIVYELDEEQSAVAEWLLHARKVEWFDCARFVGDRQFRDALSWHPWPGWDECDIEDKFDALYRLDDIPAAREWVRNNVCEGNQSRLLDLLDRMEQNPNIWVNFSW